jgi:RHS repeat-associated protein
MRRWIFRDGVSRFVFSFTVISALGLGIGAGGPSLLAALSKPAQAQNVAVAPSTSSPTDVSNLPYMGLRPSVQAAASVQEAMPEPAKLVPVSGFTEPLVATGPTTPEEDTALKEATQAFSDPANATQDFPDAAAPLLAFLAKYPNSHWAMALQTNLGTGFYQSGYYSRALEAWQQAWDAGKTSTIPEAARLTDKAVGELAEMHARVGHADELDKLFAGIGPRPISGAATELLAGAKQGLATFRNDPGMAYLCGPKALVNVLREQNAPFAQIKVADDARSGLHGFSLTQLSELATKAGVSHQLIFRQPGQAVPVPSVINLKLHHYAAIIGQDGDRYVVRDPTFASADRLMTLAAIDAESSGYFLVPAGAKKVDMPAAELTGNAAKAAAPAGDWRAVDPASTEAQAVYGMGTPAGQNQFGTKPNDPKTNGGTCSVGMCIGNAHSNVISLNLTDSPVGYRPTKGPAVPLTLTYNQREATQPANFTYFNFGQKWNFSWQSWVQEYTSTNPGYDTKRYTPGGGAVEERLYGYYYNTTTGVFSSEIQGSAVLKRIPATGVVTSYELTTPDGGKMIYSQSDGATYYRKYFLTQVIDAEGLTVNLAYDAQFRLTTITDATGKVTTLSYELPSYPLLVTKITDPFGRYTTLTYDASQRLASITDAVGITSSFVYDTTSPNFINTLKTPYGASSFAFGENAANYYYRWLTTTDAMGFSDRLEFNNWAPGIAASDAAATVPATGTMYTTNSALGYRNSYYWGRHVVATVGTTDYTKAHMRHWTHSYDSSVVTSAHLESEKLPLDRRVWYNYPAQVYETYYSGTLDKPVAIGRVLDDGTTQVVKATYTVPVDGTSPVAANRNAPGPSDPPRTGNLASVTDALGRKTLFNYATNNVDLLTVQQQISATPTYATLATYTYDSAHNLLTATDAAGQVWRNAYNAAGQLIYASNPQNQTRFWEYDASGRMTRATVPVAVAFASVVYGTTNVSAATAKSWNYTAACSGVTAPANTNLPISVTDSEGYVLCYQYDALDRVTKVKHPDGTTEQYDYNFPTGWTANGTNYAGTPSLDVWTVTDRQGRVTSFNYDRNRRLIGKTEPVTVAGVATTRTTSYSYYADGTLKEQTDANGNVTHWDIDIQSRPTAKTYAYGTASAKTETYTYDLAGRLKTVTDAKAQVLTLVRNKDDSIASYAYTNAAIATPGASFTYDPWYPRRTGMTDQFGSTSWTYKAVGTNGALGTDTEDGPFGNDTVAYGYDTLGRVNSRSVGGATAETLGYDLLGRMNAHTTDLGSFTYGYLGNSGQVSTRTIGSVVTSWGYDTNTNDRRLLTIGTTGAVARNFTYASNAYQITGITDTPAATHPWLGQSWSFSYDGSDRLLTGNGTIAGNRSFSYDKLDNATSFAGLTGTYDGLNQISTFNGSTFAYDANGNLTSDGAKTYTYDAADRLKTLTQGGTTTTFAYDGLGRRLKQTVGSTETRYLWCGAAICQERSNTDVVLRRFTAEGEYVLTGTKKYLYLTDHLGSVRDLIDITSTPTLVGSFDYTPYGAVARRWGTVTPGYTYAALFAHTQTGLLLSATRAYEPSKGRFLNRDMIPDWGFGYGNASPVLFIDPDGLDPIGQAIGGWVGGWGGRVGGALVGEVIFPAGGGVPGAIAGGIGGRRAGAFIGDKIGDAIIAMMQAQNCPPSGGNGSGNGGGGDDDDKQRKTKPKRNVDQNARINDAASQVGLDRKERGILGRYIEEGERKYGESYTYQDIIEIAREIKIGTLR